METELLQGFIKQVEGYLPTIRGGILVFAKEGNVYGELNTALREIQSINSAAEIIGFEDVSAICSQFEKSLKMLISKKDQPDDAQTRQLLDKLTELEVLLTQITFSIEDASDDVADFVEESFENLQLNPNLKESLKPIEALEETAETEEEFEIDDEMLEIFTLEAEDIVRNININLEILEKSPNNREALLEIRRNAHTLKGSAGIVGLKQLSDLAHRVEDLLDYMAENEIESNEQIFELLLTSTDCFAALGSGEKSSQLTKKISITYKNFNKVMAQFNQNESAEISPLNDEIKDSDNEASNETITKPQSINHKPIVRVSLEKLDDLVNIVSGLIISRSIFEQRLAEFERQISELHHSTNRLQRSTGKLEADGSADFKSKPGANFFVSNFRKISNELPERLNANLFTGSFPQNVDLEFDSLEFDRYTELHQTIRELVETTTDTTEISSELNNLKGNLDILFDNQRRLIDEMQEKLLRLRMVSFGSLSIRLQRTVRVICDEEEKTAELSIEGENLEIDTQILDQLIEPLLHLLRNAVAHGIEPPETRRMLGKPEVGKISLRLVSEGTHIFLTVSDDGRGISASSLKEKAVKNGLITVAKANKMTDEEAFELAFLPGLSTAEKLSQVSGRGVGLNIVKSGIIRNQGTISIASEPQRGTTFTLRLPMALAVTRAILVKATEKPFAFPLKLIKQFITVSGDDLENTTETLTFAGSNYKIVHLNKLLGLPVAELSNKSNVSVLLLDTLDNTCALVVDEIIKTEEIVIKPLGFPLQNLPDLIGGSIMGDGNIIPVLDLVYLLKNVTQKPIVNLPEDVELPNLNYQPTSIEIESQETFVINSNPNLCIMIVDDSPSVRHLTSNIIKNAGWIPTIAKDGMEALEILQTNDKIPDVILTDVEMPRMDGYGLITGLKSHETLQNIPVVMITSRASDKHRQKALNLGVNEYLIKPFEDKKLTDIIKQLTKRG